MAKAARRGYSRAYLIDGRLEDVLALLQFLGLAERVSRIESTLIEGLHGKPQSAARWTDVALQHPEFFRAVNVESADPEVSLIARHAARANGGIIFGAGVVCELIRAAVELHETQLQRVQIRYAIAIAGITLAVGALGSVATAAATYFRF